MILRLAISIAAITALGVPAATLNGDSALTIPAQDIQAQVAHVIANMKASGKSLGSGVLGRQGNLSLLLAVRTATEGAELHAHADDLMIIQQGSATMVTGGTLVDRQDDGNGESKGSSIQNGVSKTINAGDVVIVPAGVPHQMLVTPGSTVAYLLGKVKEP
jgi:mannose-6-phosphate isomerase-like protein (cupin superfamily)